MVVGEVAVDADRAAVARQVERILSLDNDGNGLPAIGERDPVAGRLQARYPGLRLVLFLSPYEAAAWALIGNQIRITQAAAIKAYMTRELGTAVSVGERIKPAFSGPPARRNCRTSRGFPSARWRTCASSVGRPGAGCSTSSPSARYPWRTCWRG